MPKQQFDVETYMTEPLERDDRLAAFSDADLSREIGVRKRMAEREFFAGLGPCDDCGAVISGIDQAIVEEFREAPDWKGWPVPPTPEYERVTGARYRTTLTCVNGHETVREEVKFFEGGS